MDLVDRKLLPDWKPSVRYHQIDMLERRFKGISAALGNRCYYYYKEAFAAI